MKVLLIIPAYNEEECILNTYNNIIEYNKKNKCNYDVIVINDGSKDKTEEILIKNRIPHISLIQNLGIGGAVQTGYKYAHENNYDIAIQFDGDGQHDEKYIINLINEIKKGNNLVIGSRFIQKLSEFTSTASRRVGIKILSTFIKIFGGKKIYDPTSGYRAADKKVIEFFANNYPVEYPEPSSSVEVLKRGYIIKEIPVEMHERKYGKSSISLTKSVYYMISVCISIIVESFNER